MLFAPDPITDDRGILARAKCSDGTVTDFYDVTYPHIKAAQDSRFFPSRMSRLVTNGLQAINNSDELLNRIRRNSQNDKKPALPLTPFEKNSRTDTISFLARYSTSQMPTACGGSSMKYRSACTLIISLFGRSATIRRPRRRLRWRTFPG
ncbi:DUF5819 family protein [Streptomyces desertarenae]|uniref:DUF5819 family protein n=1 Tax=Streptomyces desertarenae TaxID=2666184 RepID=A0ABW4PLY2_9ACTN